MVGHCKINLQAPLLTYAGIIHGDIKPENVLIFFDHDSRPLAKVTDFGYSTVFATDRDLVTMPDSGVWTAPERHYRGFYPEKAKKMDIYSFGMLCVWLLCYNTESKPGRTFRKDFEGTSEEDKSFISELLEGSENLEDEDRRKIQKFLFLSLATDPEERLSNFNELLPFLSLNR